AGLGVIASRGAEGVFELSLSGTFRRKRGDLTISFNAIEDYPFSDTYRFESRWGDRRFSIRRELTPPEDDPHAPPGSELGLGLVPPGGPPPPSRPRPPLRALVSGPPHPRHRARRTRPRRRGRGHGGEPPRRLRPPPGRPPGRHPRPRPGAPR